MNQLGLFATSIVASLTLVFAPLKADAATIPITPTSSFAFVNQYTQHVRFDGNGRLWVWNTAWSTNDPASRPAVKVYEKDGPTWSNVATVKAKKFAMFSLRFGSDGKGYSTNARKNEVVVFTLGADSAPTRIARVALKIRARVIDVFPAADDRVYVLSNSRLDVYDKPLTKKSRPVRTIKHYFPNYSQVVVSSGGKIFVSTGDTSNGPISVFTSTQSGNVEPDHTILLDGELDANRYVSDLSLTADGRIAVAYWSAGVAIFPESAAGEAVTPDTWYPESDPVSNLQGVDFDDSGVMAIADFKSGDPGDSILVYFESGCGLEPQRGC